MLHLPGHACKVPQGAGHTAPTPQRLNPCLHRLSAPAFACRAQQRVAEMRGADPAGLRRAIDQQLAQLGPPAAAAGSAAAAGGMSPAAMAMCNALAQVGSEGSPLSHRMHRRRARPNRRDVSMHPLRSHACPRLVPAGVAHARFTAAPPATAAGTGQNQGELQLRRICGGSQDAAHVCQVRCPRCDRADALSSDPAMDRCARSLGSARLPSAPRGAARATQPRLSRCPTALTRLQLRPSDNLN